MLTYIVVVTSVALLGLLVDEDRLPSSIMLALPYGGLMIFIGWWQGWPTQLAGDSTLLRPIWIFIASRITGQFIPEQDGRFHDFPIIMYFSLNLMPAISFVLK